MPDPKNTVRQKAGHATTQFVSISCLTENVLQGYASRMATRNIRVDKDLTDLSATVYPQFIHSAVCQLIENAIDSMPAGGELNVTLVEGEDCWELEVADTESHRKRSQAEEKNGLLPSWEHPLKDSLQRAQLEWARRAAALHGGKFQTWNCPLGGTANVLVIPRRQEAGKTA